MSVVSSLFGDMGYFFWGLGVWWCGSICLFVQF